jgi:hypothetical protein
VTHKLEAGSSSGRDIQENLEKKEVVKQKENIASSNPLDDQTKSQAEALIKKGEEKSLSTPNKSATNTVGK